MLQTPEVAAYDIRRDGKRGRSEKCPRWLFWKCICMLSGWWNATRVWCGGDERFTTDWLPYTSSIIPVDIDDCVFICRKRQSPQSSPSLSPALQSRHKPHIPSTPLPKSNLRVWQTQLFLSGASSMFSWSNLDNPFAGAEDVLVLSSHSPVQQLQSSASSAKKLYLAGTVVFLYVVLRLIRKFSYGVWSLIVAFPVLLCSATESSASPAKLSLLQGICKMFSSSNLDVLIRKLS